MLRRWLPLGSRPELSENSAQGPSTPPLTQEPRSLENQDAGTSGLRHIPYISSASLNGTLFHKARSCTISSATVIQGIEVTVVEHYVDPVSQGREILWKNISCNAYSDAAAQFNPPECVRGTREKIMKKITDWLDNRTSYDLIFCITGSPGSGKTAIMQTIIKKHHKTKFFMTWFFRLDDPTRNTPTRLIATIAFQIGVHYPQLGMAIGIAVNGNPSFTNGTLEDQIKLLITGPLEAIRRRPMSVGLSGEGVNQLFKQFAEDPKALFIDALDEDECNGIEDLFPVLLTLASECAKHYFPIKIVISSRSKPKIDSLFGRHGSLYLRGQQLKLKDFNTKQDIRLCIETRLSSVIAHNSDTTTKPPNKWPPKSDVETLAKAAGEYFVLPGMVIDYVSNPRRLASVSFASVVNMLKRVDLKSRPTAAVDAFYTMRLDAAQAQMRPSEGKAHDPLYIVRLVRKSIQFTDHTLEETEAFFRLDQGEIKRRFYELDSILTYQNLNLPNRPTSGSMESLWIPHTCFLRYLDDPTRCGTLYIPRPAINAEIAGAALGWVCEAKDEDIFQVIKLQTVKVTPVTNALQEWTFWLTSCIPPDMEMLSSDSGILERLQEFTKRGIWAKLANGFQNPEFTRCQCVAKNHDRNFAASIHQYLAQFQEYIDAHLSMLEGDDVKLWKPIWLEVKKLNTILKDFEQRPYPDESLCLPCIDRKAKVRQP